MDKKPQHSPISRRAFLGNFGTKAAVATALGVAAAEWASHASADEAKPASTANSQADEKWGLLIPPGGIRPPGYSDYGYYDYSEYYDYYSDYCGKRAGVAYAGLALLISRAYGRIRRQDPPDDKE